MNNVGFGWKDVLAILLVAMFIYGIGQLGKYLFKRYSWARTFTYYTYWAIGSFLFVQAYKHFSAGNAYTILFFIPSIVLLVYTLKSSHLISKKDNIKD